MSKADELVKGLEERPEDEQAWTRAALALEEEERPAEAHALLAGRFINLAAHDEPTLPCLCKRCIAPDRITAEASGHSFYRDFAVASGRVLYFWVPSEVKRSPELSRSVADRMRSRLRSRGG